VAAGDFHQVNRLLQVRPWQISPFDADRSYTGHHNPFYLESLPRAVELRAALIAAAGPPGRRDRHGRPLGPART
jgi:hypothetical protein